MKRFLEMYNRKQSDVVRWIIISLAIYRRLPLKLASFCAKRAHTLQKPV